MKVLLAVVIVWLFIITYWFGELITRTNEEIDKLYVRCLREEGKLDSRVRELEREKKEAEMCRRYGLM